MNLELSFSVCSLLSIFYSYRYSIIAHTCALNQIFPPEVQLENNN